MLAAEDLERLAKCCVLYDHNWRFYAQFLGEPFLLGQLLCYFDSRILYVCCFPLDDPWREVSLPELEAVVFRPGTFAGTEAIDLWGRIQEPPTYVSLGGRGLSRVKEVGYDDDLRDHALDVTNFSYAYQRAARLARNAALNRGLSTMIVQREYLNAEHIECIEEWFGFHTVHPTHSSFALSVGGLLRDPQVYLVEGYQRSSLAGFAIISLLGEEEASLNLAFYRSSLFPRVADAVMAKIIEFLRGQGRRRLFLGYSSTEGLRRFKTKWGGLPSGPPYREVFYAASEEWASRLRSGYFPWRERLLRHQILQAEKRSEDA